MKHKKFTNEEHELFVREKRQKRMAVVDSYPPEVRQLVHDYGLTVVQAFLHNGMKNPRHIRHCVERVLDEFSPTRGSYSQQGVRTIVPGDPNAHLITSGEGGKSDG